jgi:hypothetical protein
MGAILAKGYRRENPADLAAAARFAGPGVFPYALAVLNGRLIRLRWPWPSAPPSSSGLGHRPFKAAARVRIPLGARTEGTEVTFAFSLRLPSPSGSRSGPGLGRDVLQGLAHGIAARAEHLLVEVGRDADAAPDELTSSGRQLHAPVQGRVMQLETRAHQRPPRFGVTGTLIISTERTGRLAPATPVSGPAPGVIVGGFALAPQVSHAASLPLSARRSSRACRRASGISCPSPNGLPQRCLTGGMLFRAKAVAYAAVPVGRPSRLWLSTRGPVEQLGVLATLSRWRSRVQIPSGPPGSLVRFHWGPSEVR